MVDELRRKRQELLITGASRSENAVAEAPVRSVRARLGREHIESLVASYRPGARTTALMVDYELSKTAVLSLLRDAGVDLRRQPLTAAQTESARRLYESGLTVATVPTQLGLATESVRRGLVRAGVAMRPRGRQALLPTAGS